MIVLTVDVENNSNDKYIASGLGYHLGEPIIRTELGRVFKRVLY